MFLAVIPLSISFFAYSGHDLARRVQCQHWEKELPMPEDNLICIWCGWAAIICFVLTALLTVTFISCFRDKPVKNMWSSIWGEGAENRRDWPESFWVQFFGRRNKLVSKMVASNGLIFCLWHCEKYNRRQRMCKRHPQSTGSDLILKQVKKASCDLRKPSIRWYFSNN